MSSRSGPEPWPFAASDEHGWPDASDCSEAGDFKSELCKAKLEVRKKRAEEEIARAQAEMDADLAVEQEYYKAVLEVGKGSIERARSSADTLQKAAAAIVTLYTGVLALAFSVSENPLPGKALFAAVLLGIAILLSTAFLAYLPDPEDWKDTAAEADAGDAGRPLGEQVTGTFVRWTRKAALERRHLMRGAVVALAGSVALMPAPFVAIGAKQVPAPEVGWPAPDAAAGGDPGLQRILYKAQVDEAAAKRKAPIAQDESEEFWWAVFGFALLAVGAVLVFPPPPRRPTAASGYS